MHVRTLAGQEYTLDTFENDTIIELKRNLYRQHGEFDEARQKLILWNEETNETTVLEGDDRTLQSYHIEPGTTLQLYMGDAGTLPLFSCAGH